MEDVEEKFQKILKTFLNEKYKSKDDFYFEKLIAHLSNTENMYLLNSTFTFQWVEESITLLTDNFDKLNEKVKTFIIKIVMLFAQNQWLCIKIKDMLWLTRLKMIIENNMEKLTPSMKLAYVNLLHAVSKIGLGVGLMSNQKIWDILIYFVTENQTVYIQRESMSLIFEILYILGTKTNNEELFLDVLRKITKPILENTVNEKSLLVTIDDTDIQKKLSPILDLITLILSKSLESDSKIDLQFFFQKKINFEMCLFRLGEITHNTEFLGKILKALISLNFAQLVFEKWEPGKTISPQDFTQFGVNFLNQMKFCIIRRSCSNVLMMAEYNHVLWKKLEKRTPEKIFIEYDQIEFENQLILFHLLPVLFILKPTSRAKLNQDCAEIFESYIMKIFELSTTFTQHVCYEFREVLFDCPENAADLACKSIHSILSMEKVLNKSRSILVFQALIYTLKSFAADDGNNLIMKNSNVLYSILVGLHSIVKKHRITWNDSIESICLLNLVLDLLKSPNLTPRVAVQAIKLAQLSIEHFLSPNLALLVDNFNGSGLQNIAPMLIKRLHDNSWEVRDSTIELITSIAEISHLNLVPYETEYPAFQQYLLDSDVCSIIYSMAKNDLESYTRASAFTCLAQMSTINLLWEQSLSKFNMMEYLLSSILLEAEGVVRKEAVTLITSIYNYRKIEPKLMNKLYSTLAYCAVNDLHWEVKIYAIVFWKSFICRQFTNQGMIDGTFPTVTFSKEFKKIVTLTEKEILLRLDKILNKLSEIGCLGILLECVKDESDLEVVRVTVLIITKLFSALNKYEYLKNIDDKGTSTEANSIKMDVEEINEITRDETNFDKPVTGDIIFEHNSDNIIESILNDNDISLLSSSYHNQMNFQDENSQEAFSKIDDDYYKQFSCIKPSEFIREINKMDLESLVEIRNNWLLNTENIESLLDDMLYSVKANDVNDVDCY